jgi:hypothetical protein
MRTPKLLTCAVLMAMVVAFASARPSAQARGQSRFGGCPLDAAHFYPCAMEKVREFNPPRTPGGLPDMNGFWSRAVTTEDIDERAEVVDQSAQPSLIVEPPDGRIPYQPWAATQKQVNARKYISPLAFCDVPGIPRSSFQYGKWQLLMGARTVVFVGEGASTQLARIIRTDGTSHVGASIKLWMGDAVGHWEGNTLVVDVTNLNGKTWIDSAGDFETANVHVVERFALIDADTIFYAATIDDPTEYAAPWTISFPIPRYRGESDPEVWEAACHEGNRAVPPLFKGGYARFPGVIPPQVSR